MNNGKLSVINVRGILLVTVPSDPDDITVAELQDQILQAMQRYDAKGLVLDVSTVETIDSFFARTVSETIKMVALMGGTSVLSGMRASVAITTTQLGLSLEQTKTALNVDRALDMLTSPATDRGNPR